MFLAEDSRRRVNTWKQKLSDDEKPQRLYLEAYPQLIKNSVGTEMFRNFYIRKADGTKLDALSDAAIPVHFTLVSSRLT